MLIDSNKIITKTELRENLAKFVDLNREGETFFVSDRGELTSVLSPFHLVKKAAEKKEKFDVIAETKALREELSAKNPNFDVVKALREVRDEN